MKLIYPRYIIALFACLLLAFSLQAQDPTACPNDIDMYDLRGITAFAQTDSLVICGASDTLAFLFFSTATEDIVGATMAVDLPPGMEYAGFVDGFYAWNDIFELNVSDVGQPRFVIPRLIPQLIFVAYIGVRATCDLNIHEQDAQVNVSLNYPYPDGNGGRVNCSDVFTPIASYNSEFKLPVLNTLSVTGDAPGDANITLTDATPGLSLIHI